MGNGEWGMGQEQVRDQGMRQRKGEGLRDEMRNERGQVLGDEVRKRQGIRG